MTLMVDKRGDIMHYSQYNQLPGGVTGAQAQPLADARFPRGTTIAIAEPYLKVFWAGTRGVRVDTPADLRIVPGALHSSAPQPSALPAALRDAKRFMDDGQPAAAFETCLTALQRPDEPATLFAATVLSNMAQALLYMRLPALALQYAAVALLLRPDAPKAPRRYIAALRELEQPALADRVLDVFPWAAGQRTRDGSSLAAYADGALAAIDSDAIYAVLATALEDVPVEPTVTDEEMAQEQVALGDAFETGGDAAFRAGMYEDALIMYTGALRTEPHCKDTAVLLCCLAQSALSVNSPHTALAAAAAALHFARGTLYQEALRHLTKSLLALGLVGLARRHAVTAAGGDAAWLAALQLGKLERCLEQGYTAQDFLGESQIRDGVSWAGAVEVVHIEGKGRGLRATRDISAGEVILVDTGLAEDSGAGAQVLSMQDNVINTTSQVALRGKLGSMCARNVLVCTAVRALDDGVAPPRDKPLPRIEEMLQHLSPRVLPLLPQLFEYVPQRERFQLSALRIDRMCSVNCHGSDEGLSHSSALYPAISLINHSARPNCTLLGPTGFARKQGCLLAVRADESIGMGQELTLRYLPDESQVRKKWGI